MRKILLIIIFSLSASAQVKLMSYNTWLLPSILMTAHKPNKRVKEIAHYLCNSGHDLIALQEVFITSHFRELNRVLKKCGYDSTGKANIKVFKVLRSGLILFSKFPILKEQFIKFENCFADDCFAAKGFQFVDININGKIIHFINTHLQASNSLPRIKARQKQLKQIADYLEKIQTMNPIFVLGDFNINKYGFEYPALLASLKVKDHIVDGDLIFSSDGFLNDQKKRKKHKERELLDYIFSYNNEYDVPNRVIRPKGSYSKMIDVDLSDHFAIETEINL